MEQMLKDAAHSMRRTGHIHRRILDHLIIQESGITHSHHFILMNLESDKFASQKELAEIMSISPAAVTMALKKMEKDGYIERHVNPEDTRYNDVALTEKGRRIVEKSKCLFKLIDQRTFDGFTEEELETFIRLNDKIAENLCRLESDKSVHFRKEDQE